MDRRQDVSQSRPGRYEQNRNVFVRAGSRTPDRPVRSLVTTPTELPRLQGFLDVCCESRVQWRAHDMI